MLEEDDENGEMIEEDEVVSASSICNARRGFVDTSFCNPPLTSHGGQKGNFTLKICILILVIISLISFHQNDLDVVTIKSTGHKSESDH